MRLHLFLILTFISIFFPPVNAGGADVQVSELEDRIRVEIDGKLFTEWRHKDWYAPYFYPVVGPNGENITRNYPMVKGVEHESQDHPHHRSLRFAHSHVNGVNFWYWGPGREGKHSARIQLETIESIRSGDTGEFVAWCQWLDGEKLVLRERMRVAFTPLKNRQVLMDYDVELHAEAKPVTFGDMKDGGLFVRVAGTMRVTESDRAGGAKLKGALLNSRGDRDTVTWGKRAEWIDYIGPDASGKTVGIALFDHPSNLRYPTHWHSRTYGLLAANRFGTDHFDPRFLKAKGIACRPHGDQCPACNSHSGDYTISANDSLKLKHRIYFHHGDSETAEVATKSRDYIKDRGFQAPGELVGEVTTKPIKMLFIGNSFTQKHNIPDQVRDFAERGNPGLEMESMRVIYGGSQAERHWNNYGTTNLLNLSALKREDLEKKKKTMTEDAEALRQALDQAKIENKRFDPKTDRYCGHFNRAVENHDQWIELLDNPPTFDYVVLQSYRDERGGLTSPYAEYARKFAKVIHNRKAKMILYATAQREQNSQPLTKLPDSKPVMEKAEYLAKLGNELDALVIPVSLAIHKLREKRLDLKTRYSTDGHLNNVCAYLTLCCFYGVVFDKSPVGLDLLEINGWTKANDKEGKPMHQVFDEKTATALQQSAWEAVQEMKVLQKQLATD